MVKSNKTKGHILKTGRPPLINNTFPQAGHYGSTLKDINARRKSSKATRKLINTHHQLHKSRSAALSANDESLVREIDEQIEQLGGLSAYQAASLTGQDKDRGGDSSEKLVEWLRNYGLVGQQQAHHQHSLLRVLEVGALSSRNAISHMIGKGVSSVKRIDLHSQEPQEIEEIDFMDFFVPDSNDNKFDILSLSLVLNYVPDPTQRGKMLRRTTQFLRTQHDLPQEHSEDVNSSKTRDDIGTPPFLFLVLPLPCLSNSRYMTDERLVSIMDHLGFRSIEQHQSQKLVYMLFKWSSQRFSNRSHSTRFGKVEVNAGKNRNNFAVILEPG